MISLQHQFLFIHKPKTGGNSIQNILSKYSEDKIVADKPLQDGVERFGVHCQFGELNKHATLADYRKAMDSRTYDGLFKFSTIRNPWDLMISWYFSPHMGLTEFDRDRFVRMISKTKTLRHFVCLPGFLGLRKGRLDGQLDALIRFEKLEEDFRKVCREISIPEHGLPHRNASERGSYHEYYDTKLRDLVARRFREEIEFGEYSFD